MKLGSGRTNLSGELAHTDGPLSNRIHYRRADNKAFTYCGENATSRAVIEYGVLLCLRCVLISLREQVSIIEKKLESGEH